MLSHHKHPSMPFQDFPLRGQCYALCEGVLNVVAAPYHLRHSYKQSYFKSTPVERPGVNPWVLFISEVTNESCRRGQSRGPVKVSSLFRLTRQDFTVLFRKERKGDWLLSKLLISFLYWSLLSH